MSGSNFNLYLLPNELLIQILRYLEVGDLINLHKAVEVFGSLNKLATVLKLRQLRIKESNNYKLDFQMLKSTFLSKVNCQMITLLNMNSIYWVPAAELRKCIELMLNLESLYLLDTQINTSIQDLRAYTKLIKLKTLAITVKSVESSLNHLPNINKLCLQIRCATLPRLRKLIIQSNLIDLKVVLMNISGDARFFEALKLIYLPLRLCHTLIDETTTLIYKKISTEEIVDSSVYQENAFIVKCMEADTICKPFLKTNLIPYNEIQRISMHHCNLHSLKNDLKSIASKNIKYFELKNCRSLCSFKSHSNDNYENIGIFNKVEYMRLEGFPLTVTGFFLINIFKQCLLLKYLSLTAHSHNYILFHNFLLGIKYLNNLRDLRLEMNYLPFNKFLNDLPQISNLTRIYVKCNMQEPIHINYFNKFMRNYAHSIFLVFVIKDITQAQIYRCKRIMMDAKGSDNRKVFVITKEESIIIPKLPVLHNIEIVQQMSISQNYQITYIFFYEALKIIDQFAAIKILKMSNNTHSQSDFQRILDGLLGIFFKN